MWQSFLRALRILRGLCIRDTWKNIPRCDFLVVCSDVHRPISVQGRFYSPISDSVLDELVAAGWKCSSMAYYDSLLVGRRAHASPASVNRLFFLARFKDRLRSLSPQKEDLRAPVRQSVVRAYERILEKAACRAIIAIGSPLELYHGARPRAVKVIEVMHGLGYPVIPWGWEKSDREDLPDAILSLDPVTTKTFLPLQTRGIAVHEIQHPWLKRFQQSKSVDWATDRKNPCESARSSKRTIVVSLQWGYDGEQELFNGILPNGIMPEALVAAIRQTQESVFWMLRLHPIQLKGARYKRHRDYVANLVRTTTNCEWVEANKTALPALFACADGHVTMCSMTAYEAAYGGVSSLLLCPLLRAGHENEQYFADLAEAGFAVRGECSTENIKDWAMAAERKERFPFPSGEPLEQAIGSIVGIQLPEGPNDGKSISGAPRPTPRAKGALGSSVSETTPQG